MIATAAAVLLPANRSAIFNSVPNAVKLAACKTLAKRNAHRSVVHAERKRHHYKPEAYAASSAPLYPSRATFAKYRAFAATQCLSSSSMARMCGSKFQICVKLKTSFV